MTKELTVGRLVVGLRSASRTTRPGAARDLAGHADERSLELATHAVLNAAYAGGVRYFDAARSYGKAEAFLASWLTLRALGPGDVTVGSKWGYTATFRLILTAAEDRAGARLVGGSAVTRGELIEVLGRVKRS